MKKVFTAEECVKREPELIDARSFGGDPSDYICCHVTPINSLPDCQGIYLEKYDYIHGLSDRKVICEDDLEGKEKEKENGRDEANSNYSPYLKLSYLYMFFLINIIYNH